MHRRKFLGLFAAVPALAVTPAQPLRVTTINQSGLDALVHEQMLNGITEVSLVVGRLSSIVANLGTVEAGRLETTK